MCRHTYTVVQLGLRKSRVQTVGMRALCMEFSLPGHMNRSFLVLKGTSWLVIISSVGPFAFIYWHFRHLFYAEGLKNLINYVTFSKKYRNIQNFSIF